MNRFGKEINELGFGWYAENQCERICALARSLGISPADFNAHEMGREICDSERDLLHFTMRTAAANSLGISVGQLSTLVRAAHCMTQYFSWDVNFVENLPNAPCFITGDSALGFCFPCPNGYWGDTYEYFEGLRFKMSAEYPTDSQWVNQRLIEGINDILDVLYDDSIADSTADTVFAAFAECCGDEYIHPSMLDVCAQILKREW